MPRTTAFDPELRRLAIVVMAGAIMSVLDTTIVNVAITPLGRDFHTSLSTIQWVLTGYTLALSMTIPLTGWAVDRLGAKTAWIGALLLFIAGSVLCGVAWNVASLIIFRVLQGIGGGMIMPVGQTMLARKAGPGRMARTMAVVAIPAMLGPVLGPVLGGLIVDDLSWRWMFFVNVPVCALALILAVRMLPRDESRSPARVDALGVALLSPGLAALVYGLSQAGADNTRMGIGLGAGAIAIAAFLVRARGSSTPLISIRAFTRRAFGSSAAAMFIYTGAMFGFMVALPVYYQVVRGESPLRAGLLIAPMGLGAMLTMALSARLADRIASRWIAAAGMAIVVGGAIAYTQIHPSTSLLLLAIALFTAGLGHGAIMPPVMAAAYQGMPKPEIPSATATLNVAIRVGTSLGTAALAIVLQQAIRAHVPGAAGSLSRAAQLQGPHAHALLTTAFGQTFWWVAALAALAIVPALLIPHRAAGHAAQPAPSPTTVAA